MTTQPPDATEQVDDRFRKPAPMIDLTPDAIEQLQTLLGKAQQFASLNGLPWRRGASKGKPLLYGGEEGRGALIAYGTIGSWNEIDLAVAAVNALPALLAALPSNATTNASLVEADEVRDALIKAYTAGATDVHVYWRAGGSDTEPDFAEAASDYANDALATLRAFNGETENG